jgi:hypothetical protein
MSQDGQYRYLLGREWIPGAEKALFIMLNPSTATATKSDHTMRKCVGFARWWGCGGIVIANLFAYRATKPTVMKAHADPVGEHNDELLRILAGIWTGPRIAAWGNHGAHQDRDIAVRDTFATTPEFVTMRPAALSCLGVNTSGQPQHPLMLPYTAQLIELPERLVRVPARR